MAQLDLEFRILIINLRFSSKVADSVISAWVYLEKQNSESGYGPPLRHSYVCFHLSGSWFLAFSLGSRRRQASWWNRSAPGLILAVECLQLLCCQIWTLIFRNLNWLVPSIADSSCARDWCLRGLNRAEASLACLCYCWCVTLKGSVLRCCWHQFQGFAIVCGLLCFIWKCQ